MRADDIHFFKENIRFRLSNQEEIKKWIIRAVRTRGYQLINLNIIFCSDDYLLKINSQYLNHHYYTDIITFDNSSGKKNIEGDIFISIDRVRENADKFQVKLNDELHRVIIHGILHLLGYRDKSEAEKKKMRQAENLWLEKRKKSLTQVPQTRK